MSSLKYILDLFDKSADSLKVPYIKTTPKRLQHWAEKNKPPFIALIDLEEIDSKVRNNYLVSFNLGFLCAVASLKDPTDEIITKEQVEADILVKKFRRLIDNDPKINTTAFASSEVYRGGVYLGVGKGFTMSLEMADLNDYCGIDCDG